MAAVQSGPAFWGSVMGTPLNDYITLFDDGVLEITCRNGHTYKSKPLLEGTKLPGGGRLYSSEIDFCRECEEPINWYDSGE